jgi:predicted dehydrogenase
VEIAAPDIHYRSRQPKSYSPGIGLIGCGGIAATHLEAYRSQGWNVVALCDHTRSKAEALGHKYFPTAIVCDHAQEVFDMPGVEVIDLTPHPEHRAELIANALNAGKHVLSQKPFVLDLDLGERLCDAADERGLKLAVNQNGRWAPHLAYMREAVRAGVIGTPTAIRIAMQWDHNWVAGLPFDDVRHLLLYDFAIHWLDFVASLFDSQQSETVYAAVRHSPTQRAKPPFLAHVAVQFPRALATLSFDADCRWAPEDRTVIVGTQGVIRSQGPSLSVQDVIVTTPEGWFRPKLEGSWFPGGFSGAMSELLWSIESNATPEHSARSNLRSLALCFAAVASSDSGKVVPVGSIRTLNP